MLFNYYISYYIRVLRTRTRVEQYVLIFFFPYRLHARHRTMRVTRLRYGCVHQDDIIHLHFFDR